jgi:ribosomal protein S18 acetylase RimI-like enzyme
MNIVVRPIIPEDREQLVQVVRKQQNFLECEVDVAIEVIDETFNPVEDYQTLAAVDEHYQVHGFVSFGPIPMTVNRFDMYWIAVDPDSGRHGVGTLLLQGMENQLKQEGSGHIYIETSSTQGYLPARKFYEKNEYVLVSQMQDFYRDGDDRLIYRKIY